MKTKHSTISQNNQTPLDEKEQDISQESHVLLTNQTTYKQWQKYKYISRLWEKKLRENNEIN